VTINLYAGENLVAGHFGVRFGGAYHPWIASTNSAYAACSPGQVFLGRAILAMSDLGLNRYDLGPGHDHYKRPFCPQPGEVGEGLATAASAAGRLATISDGAWSMAGAQRLRRRIDAIAQLDLSAAGRMRGVVDAVTSALHRRSLESGSAESGAAA
jgi:CelD/BcsL family acetyltransferase involved in cellulose biosynthesis